MTIQQWTLPKRLLALWPRRGSGGYPGSMTSVGRPGRHHRPVPRLRELDQYAGQWVAVRNNTIVAHADTSRALVVALRGLGAEAEGAVIQHVLPPSDAALVGLG